MLFLQRINIFCSLNSLPCFKRFTCNTLIHKYKHAKICHSNFNSVNKIWIKLLQNGRSCSYKQLMSIAFERDWNYVLTLSSCSLYRIVELFVLSVAAARGQYTGTGTPPQATPSTSDTLVSGSCTSKCINTLIRFLVVYRVNGLGKDHLRTTRIN